MNYFWNGFEKKAAARSEMLGTAINPISAAFSPLAAAIGVLMGPYSEEEQKRVNRKDISNFLIPGAAPYRLGRRATGTGLTSEERPNWKDK